MAAGATGINAGGSAGFQRVQRRQEDAINAAERRSAPRGADLTVPSGGG